jgi:hypothetical protein
MHLKGSNLANDFWKFDEFLKPFFDLFLLWRDGFQENEG